MATHTPGPWNSFNDRGNRCGCFGADGTTLVAALPPLLPHDRHRTPPATEADANFRLIDAAPEMLAVLKELEESVDYWSEYDVPLGIVDRIRTAIAKAEGGHGR